MPACPRDKEFSSLSPSTTLNENDSTTKQNQLIDLLTKLAEKYRLDQQLVEQQTKQTDLLFSITRYVLLPSSVSNDDRRNLLQAIISTSTDLLNENDAMESPASISIPIHRDEDVEELSLNDLASEYLQGESSTVEKATPSNEIDDFKSKIDPNDSTVLSAIVLPPSTKSPLDSILFSNCLSSQTAADDAETIWKNSSSSFGRILCTKTIEVESEVKSRTSNCLFDRWLYERLTRLIDLLPKQCPIIDNSSSISMRTNKSSSNNNLRPAREYRPNPNRPNFRADFPQQIEQPRQRHPHPHPRAGGFNTFNNSHYSSFEPQGFYQQGNHYPHPYHQRQVVPNEYYFSPRDPQRSNESRPRPPNRKNTFENQNQNQNQNRRGPKNNNPTGPKRPPTSK